MLTREERAKLPLCGAKKRDGEPCGNYAGWGTDHKGFGTCVRHGGALPTHKKHALALEAKAKMVKLGVNVNDLKPHEALLGMLRASAGHVNWLRDSIMEMDDLGTREAAVILRMYDSERDRLTRLSEAAQRSGATEAEVRYNESAAAVLVSIVKEAANDAKLSPTQKHALGVGISKATARQRIAERGDEDGTYTAMIAEADEQLEKLRTEIEAAEEKRVQQAASRRRPADLEYPPEEWVPEAETVEP